MNNLKHGAMTGQMMEKIERLLLEEKPNMVMVYGDTNSTLAGALAAVKLHIPVAHVEAGLRNNNRQMPEEINRIVTDHVSSLLFCPTATAVENLRKEGLTKGVMNVGDVMYDAFLFYRDLAAERSTIVPELGMIVGGYCLATLHREENTENLGRLKELIDVFNMLAQEDCPFVLPLHPRTRAVLERIGDKVRLSPYVCVIPPVSYLDMISLEVNARAILTDSGGVQKEAYFSRVPCVTLRYETEWVETVAAGWNHIGGSRVETVVEAFHAALSKKPSDEGAYFGSGNAGERTVSAAMAFVATNSESEGLC